MQACTSPCEFPVKESNLAKFTIRRRKRCTSINITRSTFSYIVFVGFPSPIPRCFHRRFNFVSILAYIRLDRMINSAARRYKNLWLEEIRRWLERVLRTLWMKSRNFPRNYIDILNRSTAEHVSSNVFRKPINNEDNGKLRTLWTIFAHFGCF